MKSTPTIVTVNPADPTVIAAAQAEKSLFEHYQLDYKVHTVVHNETGIRVRVYETGSGDPVLIVPGGSGDAWQYVPLMAELSGYRLLAINRPGGGMSDAIDYRQVNQRDFAVSVLLTVMDYFQLTNVPIICNSMGGFWTFNLALHHPERVSLMVQMGCPALLLNTSAPFFMRLLSVPLLNRLIVPQLSPRDIHKAKQGLILMGSKQATIDSLPEAFAEAAFRFFNLPTYGFTWLTLISSVVTIVGAKSQYRLTAEQLSNIRQPVLFLWGDNDPFGGLEAARKATTILPNAQLVEMTAGHLPYIDDAKRCAKAIKEFLISDGRGS